VRAHLFWLASSYGDAFMVKGTAGDCGPRGTPPFAGNAVNVYPTTVAVPTSAQSGIGIVTVYVYTPGVVPPGPLTLLRVALMFSNCASGSPIG